jgi:hypothetical protein
LDQTMGAADWKLNIQQLQYTFQRQLCKIPNLRCQDHTRSIKYRIYPYLSITSSWDPMLCIGRCKSHMSYWHYHLCPIVMTIPINQK